LIVRLGARRVNSGADEFAPFQVQFERFERRARRLRGRLP